MMEFCIIMGALVGVLLAIVDTSQRRVYRGRRTQAATPPPAPPPVDHGPELEYLRARLAMLEDLQRRIEREYSKASGKQAISLHRQMITLDERIWKTMERIKKLEE